MKCKNCGKEFKPNPHNQRYCCKNCYEENLKMRAKARYKAKHPDKQYHRICPECNRLFTTNYANKKYCSQKCKSGVKNRRSLNYYHSGRRAKPIVEQLCWECKKATDGNLCSWADHFEYPKGCEFVKIKQKYGDSIKEMKVIVKCPIFEEG